MKKSLDYGVKALKLVWQANGIYSVLAIAGKLYDSTLYPFIQIFLLAKVLDLSTQIQTISFYNVSWIIVVHIFASFIKLGMKSLLDVKEAFLQVQMDGFIDMQISKKLTELDPATFEDPEFQNVIAQLEGIKGTLQMHLVRFTSLIDAVFKFLTATIIVSITFPLFAPIILIATIPSYIAWDRFRVKTWPYYVEKRSLVTRVTQYIKTLLSSDSTSKESIIFKTGTILLNKIMKEQKSYYKEFSKENDPWVLKIFFARIVQFCAFIYTQFLNLTRVFQGVLNNLYLP